jgi:hypothetical protein
MRPLNPNHNLNYQLRYLRFLLPLALSLLCSCALFGGAPASFDSQLATAYAAHTAVVQATTGALKAGTITAAEADKVLALAQTSRSILDAAKAAEAMGNPTSASNELILAANALTAMQQYLTTSKTTGAK